MREGRGIDRYKTFSRRTAIMGGGKFLLLSALAGRMYYLQVLEADQYRMLAEENRINLQIVPASRGKIFDRFGAELASNRNNYRIVLVPEQTESVEGTLDALAELAELDEYDRRRVLRKVRRNKRGFVPVSVMENLSWDEFARVNVNSIDLPGVTPDVGESRDYPFGELMSHVVGYVAPVSERDLEAEESDPLLALPGFRIGKSGIERVFDKSLRGAAGTKRVEVNAFGRIIRELDVPKPSQPGGDMVLTIDAALQKFAMERLATESAAAVVLDVENGDVLALASTPTFDPAVFSFGIESDEWRGLIGNPRKPLTNKTVAGHYPPGSTFKMIVALAALEAKVLTPDHTVFCPGYVDLGRQRFHCWKRGGHGWVDMVKGIYRSCDVYFYDVAKQTGIDRIAEMARRFGFGAAHGIDLPGEKPGLVPTRDWKMALDGVKWQLGETLIAGIGQGFLLTTPLQLAVMAARIGNGGRAVTPRLVRATGGLDALGDAADDSKQKAGDGEQAANGPREPAASMGISQHSLAVVRKGMYMVSNFERGTAYGSRIRKKGWELAGKTGTAQVRRISKGERDSGVIKNEEKPWEERDHAIFVAFAPYDKPRYAIAVLVEHGGSGSRAAAPVARDILTEAQRLNSAARPGRRQLAVAPKPVRRGG